MSDERQRTIPQNNSLWKWLTMVAAALNKADKLIEVDVYGVQMRIRWTKESVADRFWRPLQKALTGKDSTTEPTTTEYPEVYHTMCVAIIEITGVQPPPWPDRFGGQ